MKFIHFSDSFLFIPEIFTNAIKIECNRESRANADAKDSFLAFKLPLGEKDLQLSFELDSALSESLQLEQIHSNIVLNPKDVSAQTPGDGFYAVTARKNLNAKNSTALRLPWGIKTADCLPVALVFSDENCLAASLVHAGWKGFVAGIHTNAINLMFDSLKNYEISRANFYTHLKVVIGPAIFGISYQVGQDVYDKLRDFIFSDLPNQTSPDNLSQVIQQCLDVNADITNTDFETPSTFHYPDLGLLMCCDLLKRGLQHQNITLIRENTWDSPFLYSYRHATLNNKSCGERLVTKLAWHSEFMDRI